MTQHIYNDQDNQQLNDSIEQKARGMNSVMIQVDELAFCKQEDQPKTSRKIVNSTLSGSFVSESVNAGKALDVINPETGMPHEFQLTPEMIRNAQNQIQDGGAVILNGNGASTDLYASIKNMFTTDAPPVVPNVVYFTMNKTKVQFNMDRTIFEPLPVVRLSGKQFEKKYLEQLESYIYNDKEQLNPDNLFALIYLMDFIKNDHFPIRLNTNKHRIQMSKIVATLNVFVNKNLSVLKGISNMFNGMTSVPPQAEQKAE